MFSGLIEGTGHIQKIEKLANGARIQVESSFPLTKSRLGDSIAVNGCCLTMTDFSSKKFFADLSQETLDVTNLSTLKPGSLVNLERPVRLSDRLGGHLVQGHIDGIEKILKIRDEGTSWRIEISLSKNLRRYVISKGSITVDGISMTVNDLKPRSFALVVIPHTREVTNLKAKKAGDWVNIEVDMIGKYLEVLKKYGS